MTRAFDLVPVDRARAVVQVLELVGELQRDKVATCRQRLTELDERHAALVAGMPQGPGQSRLAGSGGRRRALVTTRQVPAEAVPGRDSQDLGIADRAPYPTADPPPPAGPVRPRRRRRQRLGDHEQDHPGEHSDRHRKDQEPDRGESAGGRVGRELAHRRSGHRQGQPTRGKRSQPAEGQSEQPSGRPGEDQYDSESRHAGEERDHRSHRFHLSMPLMLGARVAVSPPTVERGCSPARGSAGARGFLLGGGLVLPISFD